MEYMYEKTVNFCLFIVVYAGDYRIRIERREGVVHFLQFGFYFFFQIIFRLVGDFVYSTEYKAFIVRKGACFFRIIIVPIIRIARNAIAMLIFFYSYLYFS